MRKPKSLASAIKEFRQGTFRGGVTPRQQLRRARAFQRTISRLQRVARRYKIGRRT
jgi:hypothetical protein